MAKLFLLQASLLAALASSVQASFHAVTGNYNVTGYNWTNTGLSANLTALVSGQVPNLVLTVTYVTDDILRVHITDADSPRFEVPNIVQLSGSNYDSTNYNVTLQNFPFSLSVTRLSDGRVLLDTASSLQFVSNDIYWPNQFNGSAKVFGLGERVTSDFALGTGVYTSWARDNPSPVDNGTYPGNNMYGVHPFFLAVDTNLNNSAFGGFFVNANAQDAFVDSNLVAWRTIGGVVDYYVLDGPTIPQVIDQYHSLIGYPTLVPYWGLGWHQSRWGYNSTKALKSVLIKYNNLDLPLDALWSDIDYMSAFEDFTVDSTNFAGLGSLVQSLHGMNKHYVPILDSGISNANYAGYINGTAMNVFLPSPITPNQPYTATAWPGSSVWVDWNSVNATTYWGNALYSLYNQVNFDGLWLDMNEATTFCNGECGVNPVFNETALPYLPGNYSIQNKAIDLAVQHAGGVLNTEYNLHSLWGYYEAMATNNFFSQYMQKRPFIISRSTFAGEGTFASHWLGDNLSQWAYLRYSIIGIYNFHLFGIPLVGADICGFDGNSTAELCARWTQLGALYPFSRNHNSNNTVSQEPWAFDQTLLTTSRQAIRVKYSLMLYYYNLMFTQSLRGGVWFQPAFFEYPNDPVLFANSSDSFMIGSNLLVHPVLTQGVSTLQAYFPKDDWYNLYTGAYINATVNQTFTLDADLPGLVNIHVQGGSIIPTLIDSTTAMNVIDLRNSSISLVIAPSNATGTATGYVVFDDGMNPNTIAQDKFEIVQYQWYALDSTISYLTVSVLTDNYYVKPTWEFPTIKSLKIYGSTARPDNIVWYNADYEYEVPYDVDVDTDMQVVTITFDNGIISDDSATLEFTY